MPRPNVVLFVFCYLTLAGRAAFAQAGLPGPLVDVGVDGTLTASGGVSGETLTPRITFNLNPGLALTLRADATLAKDHLGPYPRQARLVDLEVHGQMAHLGPLALQGIAGAGVRWRTDFTPRYGTEFKPASGSTPATMTLRQVADHVDRTSLVGLMGLGAVERFGGRLEWRQDFRVSADSDGLDVSVSSGVSVPIGRYETRRAGQFADIGRDRVRTGEHLWITQDDGSIAEGVVGDVNSGSIELLRRSGRWLVDTTRVRRVEAPDRIRDGITTGAIIGGLGFGVYGALIGRSICECDDLWTPTLLAMTVGGFGAGGGALVGALSDSLHVGRRTILDRDSSARVSIAPILGRKRAGALATIGW